MLIYSINDYVQSDATMMSLTGKDPLVINPMIGYDEDMAPILLYEYSPRVQDDFMYFIHHDTVRYVILDTDIDRAYAIRDRLLALLNHSDQIQLKNIDDTYGRMLYMTLYRSADRAPYEPDGYYAISAYFEFCWIPND